MKSREYESGKSKCPGVMPGIGAAICSTRKRRPSGGARRVPTSGRCYVARESGRTLQTKKQRASGGASSRDGAFVSPTAEWNSIDWSKAKAEVKRLQMRIAKAVEEGRWGRARALQHILTHSFHAKALAVRRVTSNRGKAELKAALTRSALTGKNTSHNDLPTGMHGDTITQTTAGSSKLRRP